MSFPDWDRLSELGLELDEDGRNGVLEAMKRLDYRTPLEGWSWLERYTERDDCVHVHVRLQLGQGLNEVGLSPQRGEWCLVLEWPQSLSSDYVHPPRFWARSAPFPIRSDSSQPLITGDTPEGDDGAVLVDIPEFLQAPQVGPFRVLPAVPRLQPLEACQQRGIDSPKGRDSATSRRREDSLSIQRAEGGGILGDWELDQSPVRTGGEGERRGDIVEDGQLPNGMIERGPQVMDDLADAGTPFQNRGLMSDVNSQPEVLNKGGLVDGRLGWEFNPLRPEFGRRSVVLGLGQWLMRELRPWIDNEGVGVGVQKLPDRQLQITDVFVCPVDLGEAATERGPSHD